MNRTPKTRQLRAQIQGKGTTFEKALAACRDLSRAVSRHEHAVCKDENGGAFTYYPSRLAAAQDSIRAGNQIRIIACVLCGVVIACDPGFTRYCQESEDGPLPAITPVVPVHTPTERRAAPCAS